ncbi:hypothetical protein LL270_10855 [Pseudomonas aestusnigri]|nr:hypothetical protein [Halopseudomonas aestusnigri]MCC4261154.1 hypothetical protein [Halopseudomonas aestusnigri]
MERWHRSGSDRLQFAGVIEDQAHGGAGQLGLHAMAQRVRQQRLDHAIG